MQKSREGHGKNLTHLVYKLDNLFRSIRVSDENSSVTRALQYFLNLFELRTSFVFSMQHSKRRHQFPTCSDIFCCFLVIYLIVRELNDLEIEKHYKWTLKRLKVGMISSFHPHSMCSKVERVTAKNGCTSCTKRIISFKVSGFHPETRLLQRDFIF